MARRIARGDIWMYEFRRPDKIRPVVVLTRDEVVEAVAIEATLLGRAKRRRSK